MTRLELPPGWRWHSDVYAAHVGTHVGVSRDGDVWLGYRGEYPTLSDAIASHAEHIAAWEAEVRRVVGQTAPATTRDPRVEPKAGDVLRALLDDGQWIVFVVREATISGRVRFAEVLAAGVYPDEPQSVDEWRDWSDFSEVTVLWTAP